MVRKYGITFSSTKKFWLKCVIFFNVLVWRRFGVPLFPICAPLFPIRVHLVPICVTLSTSSPTNIFCCYPPPISRYFCKDSLMTPTHHPLQASLLLPSLIRSTTHSKNFHLTFPSFSVRVHSCSIRVHSCSLVFIRVPLVFTGVHSCSIRVHS